MGIRSGSYHWWRRKKFPNCNRKVKVLGLVLADGSPKSYLFSFKMFSPPTAWMPKICVVFAYILLDTPTTADQQERTRAQT